MHVHQRGGPTVRLADKFDTWTPIEADDATIAKALEDANIPALMAALVHVTGDPGLIRGAIRPDSDFFGDPQGGIYPTDQAQVRGSALEALKAYRDRGCTLPPDPDKAVVREIMDFLAGQPLAADYEDFLISELSMGGEDPYWPPQLDRIPAERKGDLHVLIIGAGMSGLLAGYRLEQAGIPFTIIEKNHDVGGTWLENTYPGCRVDSPNHTYSYSFAPNDWPQHYSPQPVLLDYFRRCAEQMNILDHIRFGIETVPTTTKAARPGASADATGRVGRRLSRATPSFAPWANSIDRAGPTFQGRSASRDHPGTRRAGSTNTISRASASPSSAPVPALSSSSRESRPRPAKC